MSSNQYDDLSLPEGWILCKSKSKTGRKYYFNRRTGKSSWTKPPKEDATTSKNTFKKKKEKDKLVKKQEIIKKCIKRKSDGCSDDIYNKKRKEESSPNNVRDDIPIKRPSNKQSPKDRPKLSLSPNRRLNSSQNLLKDKQTISNVKADTSRGSTESPKSTHTKNIANNRLSQLRADLAEQVKELNAQKRKSAPCTLQTEQKTPKSDVSQSTSQTNAKESQSSQFNNDSLHSITSPSQFFAANKILSSMKAHLPDEYNNIQKHKDTFADIERGICNQTSDSLMKPPLTPPQFVEASKLMSAIKSKLCYKSNMESPVKPYSSAMDRLESLRSRLSGELETSQDNYEQFASEAMDIDIRTIPLPPVPMPMSTNQESTNTTNAKDKVILVVDTNIFIHELNVIKNVMNSHVEGYTEQPTLLVPWRVINELDRLKDNNNGYGAICKRARPAMDYLYKNLPENDRIKVQPLRDANSHIYPCESPDDEILNCCLQQAERGNAVILVSNDKNLCTKAAANKVRGVPARELALRPRAPPRRHSARAAAAAHTLLSNILENEMRAKYDNLWRHVVYKPPPWTLSDVLLCITKHWRAVFNEVFPRIEHLIVDLNSCWAGIENKDPNSLTQSEVSNFKDLCLEVAKRCQIIPEYMELAKRTVERIQCDAESDSEEEGDDRTVIDAFERVWTVYSSYGAKLGSDLNVNHNLEGRLTVVDPLEVLLEKLPEFTIKVSALSTAMESVLNDTNQHTSEDRVSRLEAVLKDSMNTIRMDTAVINSKRMKVFCTKCRNMIQEGYSKFNQLVEVLQQCRSLLSNC